MIRKSGNRFFRKDHAPSKIDHHSGLAPENCTTLAHFPVSAAMKFLNSATDIGIGVPPRSIRRALNCASASAALICLLSPSTTALGVFFGAPIPNHAVAS